MSTKLFYALADKLDKLLEEHAALYFKERPWIENPKIKKVISPEEVIERGLSKNWEWVDAPHDFVDCSKERKQIELEIKMVTKKLEYESKPPVEDAVIQSIFGS